MFKKGDLTSKHIVIIIILIVSFAVILYFWWQFSPKGETDLEVCRNSVIARGSVPVFKESVSLKCNTRAVCITEKTCDNSAIYDKIIRVKSRDELELEIAKLMYDCWWMMGAGQVDYQGSGAGDNLYCAQCAIIDFDSSVQDKYEKITYLELLNEMRNNAIPNAEMSYMKYVYETDSIEGFRNTIAGSLGKNFRIEDSYINLKTEKGRYALVTGIFREGKLTSLKGAGLIAGGVVVGGVVAFFGGPAGWGAAAIIIKGAVAAGGGYIGYTISSPGGDFLRPMLIPFTADELNKLECKSFDTLI